MLFRWQGASRYDHAAVETDGHRQHHRDPAGRRRCPEKTAANWITAFGKGARGKVTAEFYDEGSIRQTVVLYFHGTEQIKHINVRTVGGGNKDEWRVVMTEPDPAESPHRASVGSKEARRARLENSALS
ncbi:hypothetical protein [Streptomyces sp. NPDC048357]|uniref:hypothetical protein n=1 Tax=Streptomyces sp. NPDC048357 TaxID=3154719 RepID=UPI0034147E2A